MKKFAQLSKQAALTFPSGNLQKAADTVAEVFKAGMERTDGNYTSQGMRGGDVVDYIIGLFLPDVPSFVSGEDDEKDEYYHDLKHREVFPAVMKGIRKGVTEELKKTKFKAFVEEKQAERSKRLLT